MSDLREQLKKWKVANKSESTSENKLPSRPDKKIKKINQVINPTRFCSICKKKIISDLFEKHQREVHNKKSSDYLGDKEQDAKALQNAVKGYSPQINTKPTPPKPKTFKFDEINDLNIELSEINEFKEPDDWVLNFKDSIEFDDDDAFDINIGLDLGTSYTKAIIEFRGDKFAVDWRGISNFEDPFTLPAELSVNEKKASIGRNPSAQKILSSFKVKLLQKNIDTNEKKAFTTYLKIIFYYIRAWWGYYYSDLNQGKTLLWNINIGLPLKNIMEQDIVKSYESITEEAWKRSFYNNIESLNKDSFEINHYPEYAAQINSYLNSPKRHRGLHLLIDIGAGTTDICTFNVTEDDEQNINLPGMTSTVLNHGTHTLNNERFNLIDAHKIFTETLDTEEFLIKYSTIDRENLIKIDKNFIDYVAHEIKKVLGKTKQNKNRKASEWRNGITSFICGGGINSNIYKEIMKEVQDSKDLFSQFKLTYSTLDYPGNIKSRFNIYNFHRLSVAYGLSYSSFNWPKIPTYEVDDEVVEKPKLRGDFGDNYY